MRNPESSSCARPFTKTTKTCMPFVQESSGYSTACWQSKASLQSSLDVSDARRPQLRDPGWSKKEEICHLGKGAYIESGQPNVKAVAPCALRELCKGKRKAARDWELCNRFHRVSNPVKRVRIAFFRALAPVEPTGTCSDRH